MKTFFATLFGLCAVFTLSAQAPAYRGAEGLRTPEELDEIFAPIALYPDALVALILPAATVPDDIAQAAAYLAANGDPGQLANQPWNESVQSLAHYPEIVKWMNDNLAWTQQAGDAFYSQPADVMKSVQQLRARAVAAGSLVNTPEQQVLTDGNEIRIVPAQPEVIYVPRYDPEIVYVEQPYFAGPRLRFGLGFAAGAWLNYDLNWDNYGIWVGQWHPGWDYRLPAWRRPIGGPPIGHAWRPLPGRRPGRPFDNFHGPRPIVRPNIFPGAPLRPPQARGAYPLPSPGLRSNPALPPRPNYRGYPPGAPRRAPGGAPPPSPSGSPMSQPQTLLPIAPGPTPPVRGDVPRRQIQMPASTPAPAAPGGVFGGYARGSDARDASQRGHLSRQQGPTAPNPSARPSAPTTPSPRANPPPPGTPDRGWGNPDRKRN